MFSRKDAEGNLIINNILLNGYDHMLEFVLQKWVAAHSNLSLSLEGNLSPLHQIFSNATFSVGSEEIDQVQETENNEAKYLHMT